MPGRELEAATWGGLRRRVGVVVLSAVLAALTALLAAGVASADGWPLTPP